MKLKLTYTDAQNELFWENQDIKFKIIPKGRRLGFTYGAKNACIEWLLTGESPVLWGDTIHDNIVKYVERLFIPTLNTNGIKFDWNKQSKTLKINDSYIDFRSSDNPMNWEGFGYKKIILNEAGIILRNPYLFNNAVLPMLIDYPDSQLIAGGTPKGKNGLFYELHEEAKKANPQYWTKTLSTYDNPFNDKVVIDDLIKNMPQYLIRQEIYGEFIDEIGMILNRNQIQYCEELPNTFTNIVFGIDLAISTKETADYTAICVLGKTSDDKIYIIDIIRERLQFNDIINLIINTEKKYKPSKIAIENVQFQAAVVQELLRKTQFNVIGVRPDKDKVTRFQPVAARYEQGLIYHSKYLPNYFEHELLSFPEGEHDDMVDALSLAFTTLNQSVLNFRSWN